MKTEHFEKVMEYAAKVAAENGLNIELKRDWYGIQIYVEGEYCSGVRNTADLTMKFLKGCIDDAVKRHYAIKEFHRNN